MKTWQLRSWTRLRRASWLTSIGPALALEMLKAKDGSDTWQSELGIDWHECHHFKTK